MSPQLKRSLKEIGFSGAVAVAFSVGASVATTNAQICRTNERIDATVAQVEHDHLAVSDRITKMELFQEVLDTRTQNIQLEIAASLSSIRTDISWVVATLNEMKAER